MATMSSAKRFDIPPAIALLGGVIFSLSLWAMSFSHSCRSDGCIGLVFPAGGAAIGLALQLLLLVPFFALRRARAGAPLWPSVAVWVAGSVLLFAMPLAFIK
jgi:hypothetical protein